jgi:hypothetical protein
VRLIDIEGDDRAVSIAKLAEREGEDAPPEGGDASGGEEPGASGGPPESLQ